MLFLVGTVFLSPVLLISLLEVNSLKLLCNSFCSLKNCSFSVCRLRTVALLFCSGSRDWLSISKRTLLFNSFSLFPDLILISY